MIPRVLISIVPLSLVAATFVAGCDHVRQDPPLEKASWQVEQFGQMRAVMREGDVEPRTPLAHWDEPGVLGVGALAGLEGEVTILDGQVWASRPNAGHLITTGPDPESTDRATLLTVARVPAWRSITLTEPASGRALEDLIERAAADAGLDPSQPFPFIVEAPSAAMDLHVINGFCPHGSEPPPERTPWRPTTDEPMPATIVGFFAQGQGGVMTHHATSVHMHAIFSADGRTATAHVDAISLDAGATLRLPLPPAP